VRHRSSRVAAASLRPLGVAAAIHFLCGFVFSSCFLATEIRSEPMAVPDKAQLFQRRRLLA
jgi:hypothetical protein